MLNNQEPEPNPTPSAELIPLTRTNDGIQAVLGRDLHRFLQVKTRYNDWFQRMAEYGFEQGKEFYSILSKNPDQHGRPQQDHVITLDMAKHIAMIQRSPQGMQARQYFIDVEKQNRAGQKRPVIDGNAITRMELIQIAMNAETERLELEAKNKALQPKADAYDSFIDAAGSYSIGSVAKMLGIGANKLFIELRSRGVLISKGAMYNTPYQRYMRFFEVKAHQYEKRNGESGVSYTTYVRPAGIDFIRRRLELPTIDPVAPLPF